MALKGAVLTTSVRIDLENSSLHHQHRDWFRKRLFVQPA